MQCAGILWRSRFVSGFQTALRNNSHLRMTVTDDGSTFVVLHPEEKVPYEETRALPERPEPVVDSSPLRTTPDAARRVFFSPTSKYESRRELVKLTQTTVHRWFPRSRDKRAKKTPMDRTYL